MTNETTPAAPREAVRISLHDEEYVKAFETLAVDNETHGGLVARVRKAFDDEPRFPGGIPDDLWANLAEAVRRGDRDEVAEYWRATVDLTCNGVLRRLWPALGVQP